MELPWRLFAGIVVLWLFVGIVPFLFWGELHAAAAQHQSQQMHFLAALLAARNNVAQGYAAAAQRETGTLQPGQVAHRQHLAELEWLLHRVDQHESNPFVLPPPEVLVAHQIELLLTRAHPRLRSALANRAANHARGLLLDLNQALRELQRLLVNDPDQPCGLGRILDQCIAQVETIATAGDFDEIAQTCDQVFKALRHVSSASGKAVPELPRAEEATVG